MKNVDIYGLRLGYGESKVYEFVAEDFMQCTLEIRIDDKKSVILV